MANRYRITLTEEERKQLRASTRKGNTSAPEFIHARALLLCDTGPHAEGVWKVADVAAALGVSTRTIEHLKERFVEDGLNAALTRKPSIKPPKITFGGDFDARLTALACSDAPDGRARWTARLLAEKLIDHEYVRNGVAVIFVEVEPLTGQRHVQITERRTRNEFAHFHQRHGR